MIFATKENLKKQIILTNHAKERMKQYNISKEELIAMLHNSELRPKNLSRTINKTFKHGEANDEWICNDVKIVTEMNHRFVIVITVHKQE